LGVPETTMLRKIFWEDPYLTSLETRIAEVLGDSVTLEATIFYAFSGGQESDQGSIGGHEVLSAQKVGADIHYTLPPTHGLQAGDAVTVHIDWARRYRLMRLHFAAEIILELAYRDLGPIEKIGAHIAADKARIDFARALRQTSQLSPIAPARSSPPTCRSPVHSAIAKPVAAIGRSRASSRCPAAVRISVGQARLAASRSNAAVSGRARSGSRFS
jgi:hypothetical protein